MYLIFYFLEYNYIMVESMDNFNKREPLSGPDATQLDIPFGAEANKERISKDNIKKLFNIWKKDFPYVRLDPDDVIDEGDGHYMVENKRVNEKELYEYYKYKNDILNSDGLKYWQR